jgi:DNA-binding GntR family transcriptional regulator
LWLAKSGQVPSGIMSGPYQFRPDMPKHVQIAEELRALIRSGALAPRLPIPSEPTLMQTYGVARDTARKAVAVLREECYVSTVKGMGSFVRDRDEWPSDG